MTAIKIVIIGAGSTEFTPGLLADLVASPDLRDAEVALVDIDPWAVETMTRLAQRLADERGVGLKVSGTTDRREVLPGADFVTTTIAVGGVHGWETDVRIPEKYGVYQTVGDSVGPGGVFRALRHVPEIVAIARDMEDLCPDAWLFNYTNPMSTIVRGVQKATSIRCVGLCHGVLHTREVIARDLGFRTEDVNVVFAGVNHLCWLLDVRHNGDDVYPRFREFLSSGLANPPDDTVDDPYDAFQHVSAWLTSLYGLFPSPGDRHVAEFFPWFLRMDGGKLQYGTQSGLDMTNRIFATKDTTRERLRAQADGLEPLDPELLEEAREGERLIHIIDAIVHDRILPELAVNVRNDGLIVNLPPWAIVEVPGQISGFGVRGVGVGELPEGIAGILRQRINQQELTVDAALSGDRQRTVQALLADPLMANVSVEAAEAMLDEVMEAHRSRRHRRPDPGS
ncbi:MAG: alpha-glucosidase/alpha-galactosidase [Chloroflexia bacterium]|nr:alpha-glucosidase/alpha-galactosidase [Chloroflexia bacterium]